MTEQKLIRTCSIWRALEVVGDTSTLLILEASWLGVRRFDEIRARTGLLKALLSDRLKRLVAADILEKVPYTTAPRRYEYSLTEKGRALYWTALMMLRWESRWGPKEGKIGVELRHASCGKLFDPTPSCKVCHGEVDARSVSWTEGPGVGRMAATYSRRRQRREISTNRLGRTALLEEVAQIMGDRWASLVLRSIFTGLRKFDEILRDTAMASNILSERLSWMVEIGLVEQREYSVSPRRFEYHLTEKAIDYYPILLMLMRWGDIYYVSPEGPPLLLSHKPCGKDLHTQVTCSECGEPIVPDEVSFEVVEAGELSVGAKAS